MTIKARPYQQTSFDAILAKIDPNEVNKVCAVLPTGGGKSILIAMLAQYFKGRTLILTHRIEILQQNSEWLPNSSILAAGENTLRYDSDVVVAMVQTAYARIEKYGIEYLGNFDNIILDEVQVLIFQKVFDKYEFKNLIGFTATPVLSKKLYTEIDGVEYVEDFTLSEIFDHIALGVDTQYLIDEGYLVQDHNIILEMPNFEKLKTSKSAPDGYTSKSLNEVYGNSASLDILKQAYYKHCQGKKTLIFNATTKINEYVYNEFKKEGLNVKMFDTVNNTDENPVTGKPYKRDEIIDWFENERDAILINTNVFTTGFNVTDVECVIVNRATKSLSLWIQMVGRGSRITDKIYKDFFTVIDLGQNIYEHGIWSERRNWEDYFWKKEPRLRKKMDMLATWECGNCYALNVVGILKCESCGALKEDAVVTGGREKKKKEGVLVELKKMPLPNGAGIIKYVKKLNETSDFAFKVLERRIIDLFKHYTVSEEFYLSKKEEFDNRVIEIYRPIYFAIIKSDLEGSRKRYKTQLDRMITKIEKVYNVKKEEV